MTALTLLVAVAATYSLTLLVVCDKITERPRQWVLTLISGHGLVDVIDVAGADRYWCACSATRGSFDSLDELVDHVHDAREELATAVPQTKRALLLYLVRCPWCASAYVGSVVMWSAWCFGDRAWWFVPAAALAARGVTGTWAKYANPRE